MPDADWESCGEAGYGSWGGNHRGDGRHHPRGLHRSRTEGNRTPIGDRAAANVQREPRDMPEPQAPHGHGTNPA